MIVKQKFMKKANSLKQEYAEQNGITIVDDKPKFCPNCGIPIDEGSKFCTNCGNKLN